MVSRILIVLMLGCLPGGSSRTSGELPFRCHTTPRGAICCGKGLSSARYLARNCDREIGHRATFGQYLRHTKAQCLHGLPQSLKWPSRMQHPQITSCTGASMAAARMWPSHLKIRAMPACRYDRRRRRRAQCCRLSYTNLRMLCLSSLALNECTQNGRTSIAALTSPPLQLLL